MASEAIQICVPGLVAAADLSAKQYLFGVITGDHAVDVNSSDKGIVDGVLQDKTASGVAAVLCCHGVTKVVAGAAITAGALVMSNGSGKAVTASAGWAAGRALTAAANDGDLITILLTPYGTVS
jgi:Uncharacterized conserved protein (DUF2190)